jgi:DNA polymerase delta subunit 1
VGFEPGHLTEYTSFLERKFAFHTRMIQSVHLMKRENLYGFQGNTKAFYLKITVTDPKLINKLRTGLEKNIGSYNFKGLWPSSIEGIMTFDNIQYVLRFMIDTGVRFFLSFGPMTSSNFFDLDFRHVLGRNQCRRLQIATHAQTTI